MAASLASSLACGEAATVGCGWTTGCAAGVVEVVVPVGACVVVDVLGALAWWVVVVFGALWCVGADDEDVECPVVEDWGWRKSSVTQMMPFLSTTTPTPTWVKSWSRMLAL